MVFKMVYNPHFTVLIYRGNLFKMTSSYLVSANAFTNATSSGFCRSAIKVFESDKTDNCHDQKQARDRGKIMQPPPLNKSVPVLRAARRPAEIFFAEREDFLRPAQIHTY